MMPLLTAEQMQRLDRVTIDEIGIPTAVLMENAGRAVADAVTSQFDPGAGRVLALAGLGNNGGDAVVAARHLLNRGVDVELALVGDRARAAKELELQLQIAERIGLRPRALEADDGSDLEVLLERSDLVIDGIFGTGLARPIEGHLARVVDRVNTSSAFVLAVDIPSGVDADTGAILGTAITADLTVTFGLPKLGLWIHPGRAHAGVVQVVDIGIPYMLLDRAGGRAMLVEGDVLEEAFPVRPADAHKGSFGHLLVIAGTPDRPGSALLASRAALRCGAGLVTVGSDQETVRRLAPAFGELMGASLGKSAIDPAAAKAALEGKEALVIGMSLLEAHAAAIREVVVAAEVPVVLDAGALDAFAGDPALLKRRHRATVLTPHPGEMARLAGRDTLAVQRDRVGVAREIAARTGAVVVLKGASTVIADPDGDVGVIPTGNPGMATAGTGDVLAGVIGGMLARGLPAPLAGRAGAYLHGLAGDRAAKIRGQAALVASDLLDQLDPKPREGELA